MSNSTAIWCWEQVTFEWDDGDYQHIELDLYSFVCLFDGV
jgi:hypothetical protein